MAKFKNYLENKRPIIIFVGEPHRACALKRFGAQAWAPSEVGRSGPPYNSIFDEDQ
jgi:hypothetical protein